MATIIAMPATAPAAMPAAVPADRPPFFPLPPSGRGSDVPDAEDAEAEVGNVRPVVSSAVLLVGCESAADWVVLASCVLVSSPPSSSASGFCDDEG
jgi:hypothetical protein